MKVQKIYSLQTYNSYNSANIDKHEDKQFLSKGYAQNPMSYGLNFGARVDKGLIRFYEYNKGRIPNTVKTFIEKLADKTSVTPLQAQATAFAALVGLTSVSAIKAAFPEEELFSDLKEAKDSKATRGILGTYRENKELLEMDNRSVLANNEDLTVWLVKKIFLEAKTLDEINRDFKEDVDTEFKKLYESKEISEEPIRTSTLKALGIKTPEAEYQQSLRYTREGYSDLIGDKLSQVQIAFWNSISKDERLARASKIVEKFDKWWSSLTHAQKLEMIAKQADELELLNEFKSSEESKIKNVRKSAARKEKPFTYQSDENKIKTSFGHDDLFKIWAGNNIKSFIARLTEVDKREIETIRTRRQAERWNEMSADEKTAYINRLRTGSEESRYAAIQAWNENPDIIIKLSRSLTKDHIEKPTEILYGSEDFNQYFSNSMSYFWETHPDYAQRFGESLKNAHSRIKAAIAEGKFGQLKNEILLERANRTKETADEIKNYKAVITDESYIDYPEYMKEFIDAYSNSEYISIKNLPVKYLKDFYMTTYNMLSPDTIDSWSKYMRGEELSEQDNLNLEEIQQAETNESVKLNHAIEAALAEIIYNCTQHCEVYLLSGTQLLNALIQIEKGEKNITLSEEGEDDLIIPVQSNIIDADKLNELYTNFSTPMNEYEIDTIIERFFIIDPNETHNKEKIEKTKVYLRSLIDSFGQSSKIIFSDESQYPINIKYAFLEKFNSKMLDNGKNCEYKKIIDSVDDLVREKVITNIDAQLRKRYSFLTDEMQDLYIYELNKNLRNYDIEVLGRLKDLYCNSNKKIPMPRLGRDKFNIVHKIYVLCMEQALADALFEATDERKFYSMPFENLVDCVENLKKYNRVPQFVKGIKSDILNEPFDIKLKKKINTYKLEKTIKEYTDELMKYLNETGSNQTIDKQELIYILNPYEGEDEIDMYTKNRIDTVFKYL